MHRIPRTWYFILEKFPYHLLSFTLLTPLHLTPHLKRTFNFLEESHIWKRNKTKAPFNFSLKMLFVVYISSILCIIWVLFSFLFCFFLIFKEILKASPITSEACETLTESLPHTEQSLIELSPHTEQNLIEPLHTEQSLIESPTSLNFPAFLCLALVHLRDIQVQKRKSETTYFLFISCSV